MKIAEIRTTPLLVRLDKPYRWAQGVRDCFEVVLVEVVSDEGPTGIGESIGAPDAGVVAQAISAITSDLIGRSPFDVAALCQLAWQRGFVITGADGAVGYANQLMAGVEMALWDLVGKALGQPVHRLMGGAVRGAVGYFAFPQGETAEELAAEAREAVAEGFDVVYFKVGRGESVDLANVAAVREAIGDRRLRLDANEAWDTLTAVRMIRQLARFNPEFIEQPTPRHSIEALAQVRASGHVPIAADQSILTFADVYEVSRRGAADLIVLGLHETGGLLGLRKAAIVAEAAGLNLCVHGVFETGITTCASNQVAATIPNLDDGNQIMSQLLAEDTVLTPALRPNRGQLPVVDGPGLGFELDWDVVERAAGAYAAAHAGR
jgi:muconate cycloisomerase